MNFNWKRTEVDDAELDQQLYSPSQIEVARLVRELPDDVPSMAWRSGLNEKLRLEASKIRKRQMVTNWLFRPALGLGLASVAALCMLGLPRPVHQGPARSAEVADEIVRTYSEDVQNREVIYAPLSAEAAQQTGSQESTSDPYAEDVTDAI